MNIQKDYDLFCQINSNFIFGSGIPKRNIIDDDNVNSFSIRDNMSFYLESVIIDALRCG